MKTAIEGSPNEERKKHRLHTVKIVILRFFLVLLTIILVILIGLLGVIFVFEKGPSAAARNIFCITCLETSGLKFVPHIFLSDEEVEKITAANAIVSTEELTNTDMVQIPVEPEKKPVNGENIDPDGDGIDVYDISGSTYKGKIMVVYDPSRVFVGVSGEFGLENYGSTVLGMCRKYKAAAGINAGGYVDGPETDYRGGMPIGVVISEGKHLNASLGSSWDMVGFTNENKLVCGNMTVKKALDMGVRDAVYFGPTLIVNGEPRDHLGTGSGLNPRTAIGQRADGAILLLTIDGRQSNSLGASLVDVRDQMMKFGAINAYNLDGGASTTLVYNDKSINQSSLLWGYRKVCTSILVKPQK